MCISDRSAAQVSTIPTCVACKSLYPLASSQVPVQSSREDVSRHVREGSMQRRFFLRSVLIPAVGAAAGVPSIIVRRASADPQAGWRTFEVMTRVEVADPSGVTRAWVPLPLMTDTDYQRRMGDTWKGNTSAARTYRDENYAAGFLYAEWPASEKAPTIEIVSKFATRDRAVDLDRKSTRLNSSHLGISYAVFCLKKKT